MNKDLKAQIAIGLLLLVMSFAITLQFKSVSKNEVAEGP